MLVLVREITPRILYVFDFVFKEVLNIGYEFTTDKAFYISSDSELKWVYGFLLEDEFCLPSVGLLFEKDIRHQDTVKIELDGIIPLFKSENINGLSFDIFASIFYLISRYEEYVPSVRDQHGRYAAYQSIAFQYGFLETAMVNRYILWIANWLRRLFPNIELKIDKPKAIVSIDVDHPFYSKDISLDKWLIRSIKDFSFFQEKDRYDTFDFIIETLGSIPSIFFFLCPKEPTEMDHLNRRDSQNFIQLIDDIRSKSKIGIHPSYYAEERKWLSEEVEWLTQKHGRQIKSSRFHYLRWDIEKSYYQLSALGITNDFSMAYGTHSGFRTSTSLPFYLFDLHKNQKTSIRIFTPCIMDSVFRYGSQENFDSKLNQLVLEIKNYGGVFIPIFHNDILADEIWKKKFIDSIWMIKDEL